MPVITFRAIGRKQDFNNVIPGIATTIASAGPRDGHMIIYPQPGGI